MMSEKGNKKFNQTKDDFFAKFQPLTYISHYVAKVLGMRPSDILSDWGVPELIVAYGHYANEQSLQAFTEWRSSQANAPAPKRPEMYAVKFITNEDTSVDDF